jgi:hypothetical protein
MRFSRAFARIFAFAALTTFSQASATALVVGGYVPIKQNLTVTPIESAPGSGPDGVADVATLEIDNNLPDYSLVLDFSDRYGGRDLVSEVTLQTLEGGPGPAGAGVITLTPAGEEGHFVWSPGTQATATCGLRLRVTVTYKRPSSGMPLMMVSMPFSL